MPLASILPLGIITAAIGVAGTLLTVIPYATRGEVRPIPRRRCAPSPHGATESAASAPARRLCLLAALPFGVLWEPASPARARHVASAAHSLHSASTYAAQLLCGDAHTSHATALCCNVASCGPGQLTRAPSPRVSQRKRIISDPWTEAMYNRDKAIMRQFAK